jgi:general secretion pathway protein F
MRFEVRAYQEGRITSITVDAVSQADAVRQVAARALRPLGARALGISGRWRVPSAGRFDLLLFSQELLALLEAGLSIVEALDTLAERERSGEIRGVLVQLTTRLREGQSFSGALETVPEAFPGLFGGIVRSSERTGDLPEALTRYIAYRTRLNRLRGKAISAAIYPLLLLIVGAAVTLFMGGYVVPRFATVYHGSGRPLPWASQWLMTWGVFANQHLGPLMAGLAATLLTVATIVRTALRRGGLAAVLRIVPAFAERLHTYEAARLYLTLGMLLDSGLPIIQALTLAEDALPAQQRKRLQAAAGHIRQGVRLSSAFEREGLATAVGLRMMRLGEESGRLGPMMSRAARFHDEETARWIERFSRVAEPVLMIVIGLIVGAIVVLLYMPVFDLAGSLR